MPAGTPRTVSLPPDEMIALGKEMIKWVIENDPIHLSEFYFGVKHYEYSKWDAMTQRPEFLPYYQQALAIIGYKYLRKDSPIEPSLKHRWQRVYFKDLKKSEDQDANDASERAKNVASSMPAGTLADLKEAIKQGKIDITQKNT